MNGKPSDAGKETLPAKPLVEEAFEELKPLLRPGTEDEAEVLLESLIVRESHQGPLPPARELKNYDLALPGAAERIVAMAEREQSHRHGLESTMVNAEADLKKRGQWIALAALVAMLAIVAYFGFLGQAGAGAALGSAIIVGVVVAFLGQRHIARSYAASEAAEETEAGPPANKQSNSKAAIRASKKRRRR